MNNTHSLKASSTAMSKRFRKIATGVSQIDSGYHNIIFKKDNNAYVIGYDDNGCLGYGGDRIKSKVILTPSKIGENVTNVFNSDDLVAYTKKGDIFFCGNGYGGEFYKNYKYYLTPKQYTPSIYPPKTSKMWLSNGTLAYGYKNDLYFSGWLINPIDQSAHFKPKCVLKNKLNEVKSVSMSKSFGIVNYTNGKADIMGYNYDPLFIQDKNGMDNKYNKLKPIQKFRSGVKKYVAGANNVAAIKKNGDLYIWGSNKNGIVCNKPLKKPTRTPKLVLRNVKDVSMNYNGHALALKKNGTVWAWGRNHSKELTLDYAYAFSKSKKKVMTKPVKIASNVKAITTGNGFSVILKRNGTAYWRGTI